MSQYVDGFVIPIPKGKLAEYRRMARLACKVWREHGALDYRECVGDDLEVKWGIPFPKLAKTKPEETVVFSWITFKSRKHRDLVNAKAMVDPRLKKMMDAKDQPFDCKRMSYGGFRTMVEI